MAAPMPPAALQPPAPGQYFGNRPSFSYNVVSHANARLPTGQQFQPGTVISHGFIIITIDTSFFCLKLVT
jgi:transcription elongation regulator 1